MKDSYDRQTIDMHHSPPIKGRKPKYGVKMSDSERQAAFRARQEIKGYKQVTVWIPVEMQTSDLKEIIEEWKFKNSVVMVSDKL